MTNQLEEDIWRYSTNMSHIFCHSWFTSTKFKSDRTINELWTGKDTEEIGRGLFLSTIPEFDLNY
jgi:hypothetical protein